MQETEFLKKWGGALLVGIFGILFLVRVFFGAGSQFLNGDELELMRSVGDRFLGVPQTSLAWPATTIQLLLFPIVFLLTAVEIVSVKSADGLSNFLSNYIYGPEQYTIALRATLMIAICAVSVQMFRQLKADEDRSKWIISIVALCASPIFVHQSYMIAGDSLAALLMLVCLCKLVSPRVERTDIIWAAIAFGAAIGCRATFVLYIPLILFLIIKSVDGRRNSIQSAVLFGAVALLSIIFFLPAIWMDPIRLLKSILGNAGREGVDFSFSERMMTSLVQIGPWTLLAMVWAILRSSAERRMFPIVLVIYGSLLLMFINTLGVVYDRYYLMIVPMFAAVFFAVGFLPRKENSHKSSLILSSLGVGIVLLHVVWIGRLDMRTLDRIGRLDEALIELPSGTVVWMDVLFVNSVDMRMFDRESIDEAILSVSGGLQGSLSQDKIGAPSGRETLGSPFAFLEDELAMIARLRTVRRGRGDGQLKLKLYGSGIFSERYGVALNPQTTSSQDVIVSPTKDVFGDEKLRRFESLSEPIYVSGLPE
ncbi:hypothetical protein C0431_10560 [bacterium]|nr:hypothetical protein [bacterium]